LTNAAEEKHAHEARCDENRGVLQETKDLSVLKAKFSEKAKQA
jgi:hypothetical protein